MINEFVGILVLEDSRDYQRMIREQIPDGWSYKFIVNNRLFKEFVDSKVQARLHFLEDRIYEMGSRKPKFIENCSYLLKEDKHPDAKIFCIEEAPSSEVEQYCNKHKIPIIGKREIGDIIRKELVE